MAVFLDSVQREQTKLPTSQFFHGTGLTSYFTSCCLRVQLVFKPHVGADCIPSWSLKELESTFLAFFHWLVPSVKSSYQLLPGRRFPTHIAPPLYGYHWGDCFPNDPCLGTYRAWHSWITQDHIKQRICSSWAWALPVTFSSGLAQSCMQKHSFLIYP